MTENRKRSGFYHPKVLLLGNGIQRSFFSGALSWESFLEQMTINERITKETKISGIPFGLEVVLRTKDNVDKQIKSIAGNLDEEIADEEYTSELKGLLSLGFDEIITTNYDFHLESAALGIKKLNEYQYKKMTKNQKPGKRAEGKYFIHTAQVVSMPGKTKPIRIWHVHGHVRNTDSMVIGHYYYGNLIYKYKEYLDKMMNQYEKAYDGGSVLNYDSWIDAFITGDVYILGFGLDFSEIDLWWLINRKARESAGVKGKTVFYGPTETQGFDAKKELLAAYGVDVDTSLGIQILSQKDDDSISDDERNRLFREYYKKAIRNIKKRMD